MSDQTNVDPLRQRVEKGIRFRDSDPPEVREALIREAMRNHASFTQSTFEAQKSSD